MTSLYAKLAAVGIKKNGKSYVPYILTSAIMIMIFYIISFLSSNPMLGDMVGGSGMVIILNMGIVVMAIFAAIFLFYTNSFLIKRRKKEFGLYNILGLGKRQIARILIIETLMVYGISEIAGIGLGILFSKLAELLAMRMLHGSITYSFSVDPISIITSLIWFAIVFTAILLNSLRQLWLSKPIELLHSDSKGEKPPRSNIPAAVIGFILLAIAYAMAIAITDPLAAMPAFLLAVILVIAATFLLFIAGSVVLCRILQKNKNYYYKTNHFISTSQMAYRMKRNGAGLASICILSTMVLVTLSSTTALYVGIPDLIKQNYPNDIIVTLYPNDDLSKRGITAADVAEYESVYRDVIQSTCAGEGFPVTNENLGHNIPLYHSVYREVLGLDDTYPDNPEYQISIEGGFTLISEADDNVKAAVPELGENDMAVYEPNLKNITEQGKIKFGDLPEFNIIPVDVTPEEYKDAVFPTNQDIAIIYVRDLDVLCKLYNEQYRIISPKSETLFTAELNTTYNFDIIDETQNINNIEHLRETLEKTIYNPDNDICSKTGTWYTADTKATLVANYYGLYGGLFFLGILLGGVFMLAAALIMYYKQISEGFEDAARFDILRKVGMTRSEIKSAINSQVLTVFFLPLIAAGVHMAFAFFIISRMLKLMALTNTALFGIVLLICYLVFAALYVLFYKITSGSYFAIVSPTKHGDK